MKSTKSPQTNLHLFTLYADTTLHVKITTLDKEVTSPSPLPLWFNRNIKKKENRGKIQEEKKEIEKLVHPQGKTTSISVCLHATTADIFGVKAYTHRIAVRGRLLLRPRDEKLIFRHEMARSSFAASRCCQLSLPGSPTSSAFALHKRPVVTNSADDSA